MAKTNRTLYGSLLDHYAKKGIFVKHHLDSYNYFVEHRLQEIIREIGEVKIELPTQEDLKIRFGRVRIEPPIVKESDGSIREILPLEARLRSLTYAAPLFVEMVPVFEDVEHEPSFVNIGDFPVMVRSKLCRLSRMSRDELIEAGEDPDDPGGYFIINGVERVLVLFEEIAPNKLVVEKDDSGVVQGRLDSKRGGFTQRHIFERDAVGMIGVKFGNFRTHGVPLVVLMRALGLETDKQIIDAVSRGEEPSETLLLNLYMCEAATREEAIEQIARMMGVRNREQYQERVENVLDNYLLPHLGQHSQARLLKAHYLARIMRRMDRVYTEGLEDDIDHYMFKRLRLAGDLLESILRSIILGRWGLVVRLQWQYQKMIKRGRKFPNLQSVVITDVLTKQIMRAMAVGSFKTQTGVSQKLEKSNFTRMLDHMRNVVSPLSSTQEHFEARELHPTHWGRLDVVRTPEGQNIGLRKFLALGADVVTRESDQEREEVTKALYSLGVRPVIPPGTSK